MFGSNPYDDYEEYYNPQYQQRPRNFRKEFSAMIRNIFYLMGSALIGMVILQLL